MSPTAESSSVTSDEAKKKNIEVVDEDEIDLLPKTKGWLGCSALCLYQGFWCPRRIVGSVMRLQSEFVAEKDDIIIASYPKAGTTWVKALVFSIVNRSRYSPADTPLLTSNPHQLVPFLEFTGPVPSARPRLLSTHIPYASFPESLKRSRSCRIVYVCRNPLDVVVSFWHFATRDHPERRSQWTMDEYVDKFCKGEHGFGPFWDHVLGFWKESLDNPRQVLFFNYEDLKEDTASQIDKLARYLGFPFSQEEHTKGVLHQIIHLCSLTHLKDLQVNKNGKFMPNFQNRSYFRKGEIGDWINHLTSPMAERINKVIQDKISGSGLTFKTMSSSTKSSILIN